jgi:hypothetical protein
MTCLGANQHWCPPPPLTGQPRWGLIDKALDLGFGEPEETYSTSDHFYEELEIPRDVTGVLPRAKRTRAGLDAEAVEDLGETGRSGSRGGPSKGGGHGRNDRPSRSGVADEGKPRERRDRSRRRTRGGQAASDTAPASTSAAEGTSTSSPDGAGRTDGDRSGSPRRRRRRSRSGGGSGAGSAAGSSSD